MVGSSQSGGAATTIASIQSERSSRSRLSARSGRPARPTNAFGRSPPSREPEPAATRMAQVVWALPAPPEVPAGESSAIRSSLALSQGESAYDCYAVAVAAVLGFAFTRLPFAG